MTAARRKLVLVGAPRSGARVIAAALRAVLPGDTVDVEWDALHLTPAVTDISGPDTHVVLVVRNPVAVISSMLNAWSSRRFATDRELPGWWGDPWSFAVLPDW